MRWKADSKSNGDYQPEPDEGDEELTARGREAQEHISKLYFFSMQMFQNCREISFSFLYLREPAKCLFLCVEGWVLVWHMSLVVAFEFDFLVFESEVLFVRITREEII